MKKSLKYSIFALLVLIIIALILYVFLSKNKLVPGQEGAIADKPAEQNPVIYVASSTAAAYDPAVMTNEERVKLRVSPTLNVEVLRRNASGTPTDYRIVK